MTNNKSTQKQYRDYFNNKKINSNKDRVEYNQKVVEYDELMNNFKI